MNVIDKLMYHWSQPGLRIFHTLLFNLRLLPIKQAIKLPIFIYGPVKFYWIRGKIEINTTNIFSGMIKLGRNNELFNGVDGSAFILLEKGATIVFKGPCAIGNNYKIRVSNNARLTFGAYTFFGSSIKFICTQNIHIGDYTRCAYESQFVDSNFHFVLNDKNNTITRRDGHIYIGERNWIGNRTSICKGCKTRSDTIVCAGSLINKDYTKNNDKNMMLGGSPAKMISSGLKRIFSTSIENEINAFFKENKNKNDYQLTSEYKDDFKDINHWFEHIM